MSEYGNYRAIFQVRSSVVSSFQADTLFGHLCWAIRYLEGEEFLRAFLSLYDDQDLVPLVISSGFPEGYLPKPTLPPLSLKDAEELLKQIVGDKEYEKIEGISRLKRLKGLKYIPITYVEENINSFSQKRICEDFLTGKIRDNINEEKLILDTVILRSSIDRQTGRAREGLLFSTGETFYSEALRVVTYIKLRQDIAIEGKKFDKDWLRKILSYIEISGYGADSSRGKGEIRVDLEEGNSLPESTNPNAVISLSNFIPAKEDPLSVYYQPMLKFGKLAEHYAMSGSPFKKPLLMFEEGSVLILEDGQKPDVFYGKVLGNIHSKLINVRHYGLLYPLAIKILTK